MSSHLSIAAVLIVTTVGADRAEPPFRGDLEELAERNTDFRRVLYTGPNIQVVAMALQPGEEIGEEVHDVDQCLFIVEGKAETIIAGRSDKVGEEDTVCVPAGTRQNIKNAGDGPLKLYTTYAPPQHAPGTVQHTKADAARSEEHAPPRKGR